MKALQAKALIHQHIEPIKLEAAVLMDASLNVQGFPRP